MACAAISTHLLRCLGGLGGCLLLLPSLTLRLDTRRLRLVHLAAARTRRGRGGSGGRVEAQEGRAARRVVQGVVVLVLVLVLVACREGRRGAARRGEGTC